MTRNRNGRGLVSGSMYFNFVLQRIIVEVICKVTLLAIWGTQANDQELGETYADSIPEPTLAVIVRRIS